MAFQQVSEQGALGSFGAGLAFSGVLTCLPEEGRLEGREGQEAAGPEHFGFRVRHAWFGELVRLDAEGLPAGVDGDEYGLRAVVELGRCYPADAAA